MLLFLNKANWMGFDEMKTPRGGFISNFKRRGEKKRTTRRETRREERLEAEELKVGELARGNSRERQRAALARRPPRAACICAFFRVFTRVFFKTRSLAFRKCRRRRTLRGCAEGDGVDARERQPERVHVPLQSVGDLGWSASRIPSQTGPQR